VPDKRANLEYARARKYPLGRSRTGFPLALIVFHSLSAGAAVALATFDSWPWAWSLCGLPLLLVLQLIIAAVTLGVAVRGMVGSRWRAALYVLLAVVPAGVTVVAFVAELRSR
jgi:hypothetical protein